VFACAKKQHQEPRRATTQDTRVDRNPAPASLLGGSAEGEWAEGEWAVVEWVEVAEAVVEWAAMTGS